MIPRLCLLITLLVFASDADARAQDDAPLTIADLDSYQQALRPEEPGSPLPEPVSFRDLWERPESYLGRRVAIEGRAARRFHQPKIGEYPPLVELWIASKAGDLTCAVYPEPEGGDPTPLGGTVRFVGSYQKRLKYESGDEARLAPLLVGPAFPELIKAPSKGPWRPVGPFQKVDWLVGGIVAAAVVLVIIRQVLTRPRSRLTRQQRRDLEGPPPDFIDSNDASSNIKESDDGSTERDLS